MLTREEIEQVAEALEILEREGEEEIELDVHHIREYLLTLGDGVPEAQARG